MAEQVTELRRGRNFIRVGDTVRVSPSRPKRRDGFTGLVRSISISPDGHIFELVDEHRSQFKTVHESRVERMAQTRDGERIREVRVVAVKPRARRKRTR